MTVYLKSRPEFLIERHFVKCGLKDEVMKWLEGLPKVLARRLGRDSVFWQGELASPTSKFVDLGLTAGALEWGVNWAEETSKRSGKSFCERLEEVLKGGMENWLVNWIDSMLREYHRL